MAKYDEEDIEIMQDVVKEMIQILNSKEDFLNIFLDGNISINSFKDLVDLFFYNLFKNLNTIL